MQFFYNFPGARQFFLPKQVFLAVLDFLKKKKLNLFFYPIIFFKYIWDHPRAHWTELNPECSWIPLERFHNFSGHRQLHSKDLPHRWKFPCLFLLVSFPLLSITEKNLAPSSWQPPLRHLFTLRNPPSAGLTPGALCLSCTEELRTGHSTPDVLHQGMLKGQDHLPRPAENISPHASQDIIGLFSNMNTLLAHGQLALHKDPQVPPCRAAFQPSACPGAWCSYSSGAESCSCFC